MSTTKSITEVTKNHGILRVTEPAAKPGPWIPKALAAINVIHVGGMTFEEEHKKYGTWKMKALKTCRAYGHQVEIGETFQLPGNAALNFAYGVDAEFVDEDGRKAKEEQLLKDAASLAAPVDYQTAPQFSEFPDRADQAKVKRLLGARGNRRDQLFSRRVFHSRPATSGRAPGISFLLRSRNP